MSILLCRIELNKKDGVTIYVDNEKEGINHTIALSSSEVTTTSKNDNNTSTITQSPDKIAIDCKSFELKAETILCHATNTTTHISEGKYSMECNADFSSSVKNTASLSADAIKSEANSSDLDATEVTIKGKTQVEISGGVIKLQ